MNVRYFKNLIQAFVAGDSGLKKLTELLQDRIGTVEIRADYADGFSRKFETINDLIAYENPKSKEIHRVRLNACSEDSSKSATIDLPSSSGRGIAIDLTAHEDVVAKLREDTLDIIAGMRPWYNWVSCINISRLVLAIFLLFQVIAWLILRASEFTSDSNEEEKTSFIDANSFMLGWLAIMCIWFVGDEVRDSLFPQAVFTIGQGASRFKNKEWARRIVIGFLVSLATGLVILIFQAIAGG